MSIVLKVFGHKPKYSTHLNFDLMLAAYEKLGMNRVIRVHPEGNVNMCKKYQGNPSNTCQDISLKATM